MDLPSYRKLLSDTNNGLLMVYDELDSEQSEPAVADGREPSPFQNLFDDRLRGRLIEAIEALPEREKLLLSLFYQEELNLKEIGAVMGVTSARVCQLHNQAVSRLRARLRDFAR